MNRILCILHFDIPISLYILLLQFIHVCVTLCIPFYQCISLILCICLSDGQRLFGLSAHLFWRFDNMYLSQSRFSSNIHNIYLSIYLSIYIYIYIYIYICVCVCVCVCACACVCVYQCVNIYIYIHTYIHIYINIYIYI